MSDALETQVKVLNLSEARSVHLQARSPLALEHYTANPLPIVSDNEQQPQRIGWAFCSCGKVEIFLIWNTTERFDLEIGYKYYLRARMSTLWLCDAMVMTTKPEGGQPVEPVGPEWV